MTGKKTYEDKMTDLDAKIKALKQQKKKLKKDHEVKDLKLKLSKQSEQIAQLTAENADLKSKLAETDMQTVPFPADKKVAEQSKKIDSLSLENRNLKEKLSPFEEYRRQNSLLNYKLMKAMELIRELSKRCGQDPETYLAKLKKAK